MRKVVIWALLLILVGSLVVAFTPMAVLAAPTMIYDVDDLQDMDLDLAGDYELANNIDASATSGWNGGAGFEPVGDGATPFTGTLDGQGYTIKDLYISRGSIDDVGLFGRASGTSGDHVVISGVLLVGADITGDDDVAILVGYAYQYCDFIQCYVSGSVSGDSAAGGITALLKSGSTVTRCASYASVTGRVYLGSLVGSATGFPTPVITDSYARGSVTASDQNAGGLGGLMSGTLTNCYSIGLVSCSSLPCTNLGGLTGQGGSDTVCFWDTETSGWATSGAGTGKTTTEMKTESTFTSADWDFTTIWGMKAYVNDGYPYLQWWYDPTPFASWDQILWFEPITIISGTMLPDRVGTAQNGAITWGDNPAGIAIDMGELVAGNQPPIVSTPDNPATSLPDMTGESGQPDWTATQPTLTDNPFYPVVDLISSQMNVPLWLVWVILALFILLIIMAVSFRYAPHQLITALAGGGWCAFMYHMGIFPFWVMFIFAAMALAIVIGERTPTVS